MSLRSAVSTWVSLPTVFIASVLVACSADGTSIAPPGGDPANLAAPDVGPTRFPSAPSLQVDRVLDPDTPVFWVAREDGAPEALALLAAKDSAGNARAITGVAFVAGDHYLSVEYDTQGRPERLTSPSVVLRLFDYDAASVTLQTTDANGDTTTERISFEREELDALRVALPSAADLSLVSAAAEPLSLLEKAGAGRSPLEDLIAAGINMLGCVGAGVATTHEGGLARALMGALATVECGGLALRADGVKEFIGRYHRELEAIAYIAGCVGGIGAVVGAPLNPAFGVAGALSAAYDCPEAAKKVTRLINDRAYAARVSQGFTLIADTDLVVGEDNPVTLRLTTVDQTRSLADASLGRVVANLGAVGGAANTELFLRDGVWQWTGVLHPLNAGRQPVLVSIGSRRETLDLSLRVLPDRNPIEAQVFASKTVVKRGESVEVFVLAQGGREPYRYFWTEQYAEHSSLPMPDLGRVSSFNTVVNERVRYAASVTDAVWTYKDAGFISIEVCGDGECRAGEEAACPADCGDRDAKLCHEACTYRDEVLQCGGFPYVCEAVCTAVFVGLAGNRPCAALDLELQRCTYSRAALDLGCETTDGGAVCKPQREAADRCSEAN